MCKTLPKLAPNLHRGPDRAAYTHSSDVSGSAVIWAAPKSLGRLPSAEPQGTAYFQSLNCH
jgi:hypothetical protein